MLMAAYSYIPKTTSEEMRSIRYAIMDFAVFLGTPIGLYIGGLVIHMKPMGVDSLHNCIGVFLIVLGCHILSLIWVLIAFHDSRVQNYELNQSGDSLNDSELVEIQSKCTKCKALKRIFKLKNATETLATCFKARPDNKRQQLWLLISALYIVIMTSFGEVDVLFQFTERVFQWNATFFSNVNAVGSIASNTTQAIFVVILVKCFKAKDIRLAIIGCVSLIFQVIMRGSLLFPVAFYLSYIIGGVNGMATIGIRSFISRLVAKEELGKVFCVMAALEATMPLTSNIIFA
ncbi:proton-coupled folate transporter-like protein, partial [Leptotrombidium deliense]